MIFGGADPIVAPLAGSNRATIQIMQYDELGARPHDLLLAGIAGGSLCFICIGDDDA